MNLVVGFANGREKTIRIDSYSFDKYEAYLEIFRHEKSIGVIALNQITYWYVED